MNMIPGKRWPRPLVSSVTGLDTPNTAELMGMFRKKATDQTLAAARELKADAVVCVRYHSSQIMAGAAEVLALGTAVRLR